MAEIVTIAGSPSMPSRSAVLLEYACQIAADFTATAISIRDLPAEALLRGRFDDAEIHHATTLVSQAKGIMIATPVYKASYTGVLKTFLDILPPNALAGKTVLPIVSGGSPAHSLVLDYALKPVLAALGASRILNGLYLIDSQFEYKNGLQFTADDARQKYEMAIAEFIHHIRSY